MKNGLTQNPIRINHIGYISETSKRFILTDNKTESLEFTVEYLEECVYTVVYRGQMEECDKENGIWVGDFSAVTKPGDYVIRAGTYTSRQFIIYEKAYDNLARILLSYFTYQRCGSELGWAGKCHLDDGYIKETGEHIDLSGGYHQSCDLRKSPGGVSIGVLGMLRYALKDNSLWGKRLFADEVKWACEYYIKTIQPNGAMYNTLNAPHGWKGRIFYKHPAPSSAQWCTTAILALGYCYLKELDADLANKCLDTALRSWKYMIGEERSNEVYSHPDKVLMGMDNENFYSYCKKGNIPDMSYMSVVAADLYRATGDKEYLEFVKAGADKLIDNMPDGDLAMCITLDNDSELLTFNNKTYSWMHSGFMCLCEAAELLDDKNKYLAAIKKAADAICNLAEKNPWNITRTAYCDSNLDEAVGHAVPPTYKIPTIRQGFAKLEKIGSFSKNGKNIDCYYEAGKNNVSPTVGSFCCVFLKRASELLGQKRYAVIAQSQIDLILGANPLDISYVNGIGCNHAAPGAFGQFFPSTPWIPGGIPVTIHTIGSNTSSEYDMPCVGMFMYLLSEFL